MKTLQKVVLFASLLATNGCVPKSQIKRSYDEGYSKANLECVVIQSNIKDYINRLLVELSSKTERLRRFNQVDEDGTLRTKSSEPVTVPVPESVTEPEAK